jgi:hypothetical protein
MVGWGSDKLIIAGDFGEFGTATTEANGCVVMSVDILCPPYRAYKHLLNHRWCRFSWCRVMDYREVFGIGLECWKDGKMERWKDGKMECWNVGMLE